MHTERIPGTRAPAYFLSAIFLLWMMVLDPSSAVVFAPMTVAFGALTVVDGWSAHRVEVHAHEIRIIDGLTFRRWRLRRIPLDNVGATSVPAARRLLAEDPAPGKADRRARGMRLRRRHQAEGAHKVVGAFRRHVGILLRKGDVVQIPSRDPPRLLRAIEDALLRVPHPKP